MCMFVYNIAAVKEKLKIIKYINSFLTQKALSFGKSSDDALTLKTCPFSVPDSALAADLLPLWAFMKI